MIQQDIIWGWEKSRSFLAVGFFTPNYRPLAEVFAKNLRDHDVPHHLYAWETKAWERAILYKPHVIKRAMQDYPDVPILLLDVDCRIRSSPLADHLPILGDVALPIRVKIRRKRRRGAPPPKITVWASSRISLWRQQEPALRLLENWHRLCADELLREDYIDDEQALMQAIGSTPNVFVNVLGERLSALNPKEAPLDAIVIHESEHVKAQLLYPLWIGLKNRRRALVSWVVGKPYREWRYGKPEL